MHLFPCNGHFSLFLLLMGKDCFALFTQPGGFRASVLYHSLQPFFVVPYSSSLPHTHNSHCPLHINLTLHLNLNFALSSSSATKALFFDLQYRWIPSLPSTSIAPLFQLGPVSAAPPWLFKFARYLYHWTDTSETTPHSTNLPSAYVPTTTYS